MGIISGKKAALFDLGSTLIEYENIPWPELFRLSLKRAHEYLGSEKIKAPDFPEFYSVFLERVIEVEKESDITQKEKDIFELFGNFLTYLGISGNSHFLENFLEAYYQPVREQLTIKDNAVLVLEYFKNREYKTGLISNTVFPHEYHLEDMRNFGILKYFDKTVFSSNFSHRKPHPSIFNEMLRMLDISADEAFFIGDRLEIDVRGANSVNLYSVLIRKKGREYGDLSSADLVIDNLSELLK